MGVSLHYGLSVRIYLPGRVEERGKTATPQLGKDLIQVFSQRHAGRAITVVVHVVFQVVDHLAGCLIPLFPIPF